MKTINLLLDEDFQTQLAKDRNGNIPFMYVGDEVEIRVTILVGGVVASMTGISITFELIDTDDSVLSTSVSAVIDDPEAVDVAADTDEHTSITFESADTATITAGPLRFAVYYTASGQTSNFTGFFNAYDPVSSIELAAVIPPAAGTVRAVWDASNSASITLANTDQVQYWAATYENPQTDNGNSSWQLNTSVDEPVVISAGLNGLDYIRHSSSYTSRMNFPSGGNYYLGSTPCAIYMLCRVYFGTFGVVIWAHDSTNTGLYRLGLTSGKPYLAGATSLVHGSTTGTGWVMLSCIWNGSGLGTNKIAIGSSIQTGTWIKGGSANDPPASSYGEQCRTGCNLDLAEVVYATGTQADADITAMRGYFNDKWGTSV